jgi:hypothetical protein
MIAVLMAIVAVVMAGLLLVAAIVALAPVVPVVPIAALLVAIAAPIMAVIVIGEGRGSCQQARRHQCRKKGFDVHVNSL